MDSRYIATQFALLTSFMALSDADDAFLLKHNLNKGSMTLVDEKSSSNIYSSMKNKIQMSGGSAANTIYGLAQLGCRSAFIGKRSNDNSYKKH